MGAPLPSPRYDNVEQRRLAVLHGHRQSVLAMAFSADGKRLASVSAGEEAVKLWDVATGRELLTLQAQDSHFDAAEFSDDDSTLLIGLAGKCIFWRVPSWQQIEEAERTGGGWQRSLEK
jgi:WD40 repeat protein